VKRIRFVGAALVAAVALGVGASGSNADVGPIASYSFDEGSGQVAHDSSGKYHEATLHGAEWTEIGKYGGALRFDPANKARLTIPASPELNFSGPFSLEAWVRPEAKGEWDPILAKTEAENPHFSYVLYADNGEGHPQGTVFDGVKGWATPASKEALALNTWTHLALISDSEHTRLYVNGKLIATEAPVIPQSTEAALRIGGNEQWSEYFDGEIDNVRVYARALSSEEVIVKSETPVPVAPGGPIASYSFDEGSGAVAHDSSGKGHEATLQGAEWTKEGKYGGSLRFDPTKQARLTIPASPELNFTGPFSLEAWVRPEEERKWAPVFAKTAPSEPTFSYQLYARNGEGRPEGRVSDGKGGLASPKGTAALALNTWTHLALVSDGEHTRLYVNGKLVATEAPIAPQSTEAALRIGGNEQWSQYFKGEIDNVRVYARALSEGEVLTKSETPVPMAPGGPIASYSFDEGTGAVAHDSSGEGRDATLYGAEWTKEGKYSGALRFNPANKARLSIPASPELNFTGPFSLEAWVRPEAKGEWDPVFAKTEAENPHFSYVLYADNGEGHPQGTVFDGTKGWATPAAKEALALNTWTHLALVSDGEDTRLYVNGKLVATERAVIPQGTEAPLRIGGNEQWGEYFNGKIDNVRVYARALSSEEVNADLAAPVSAKPTTTTEAATALTATGATLKASVNPTGPPRPTSSNTARRPPMAPKRQPAPNRSARGPRPSRSAKRSAVSKKEPPTTSGLPPRMKRARPMAKTRPSRP